MSISIIIRRSLFGWRNTAGALPGLVGAITKCGMSGDASLEMRARETQGFEGRQGRMRTVGKEGGQKGDALIAGALDSGDIKEKESEEWERRTKDEGRRGIDNGEPGSPPYYI